MTDVVYSNAFIAVHSARNMLTKEKVRAMVNAPTLATAAQVLLECGYDNVTGTDDEIIDMERTKTIKTFLELCNDEALAFCIKARYDFANTPLDYTTSYEKAEKDFFAKIAEQIPNIKDKEIGRYFQIEVDAAGRGVKPSGDMLYKIAEDGKNELGTMKPLFHWYVLKQIEFKVVKTILMGKRFEFSRETIINDLRGLHERFV